MAAIIIPTNTGNIIIPSRQMRRTDRFETSRWTASQQRALIKSSRAIHSLSPSLFSVNGWARAPVNNSF